MQLSSDSKIRLETVKLEQQAPWERGHFSNTQRGRLHGDVFVRQWRRHPRVPEQELLRAFKSVVAGYQRTRHNHVLLFRGYCDQRAAPSLVMHFLPETLYSELNRQNARHLFTLPTCVIVAVQICEVCLPTL